MDEKNKDIKSNHDFGYPHTLEELETALDNADDKYPWLR